MVPRFYEYPNFYVRKESEFLLLNTSENHEINFKQKKLFNSILNFGYIPFDEGVFKINDLQIVDFWKYSKSSVLSNMNIENYYSLFNTSSNISY